jgi:uncharacterized protein YndB with AHSA1/START domain
MSDASPLALRVERTYDAPAPVVFEAWTSPEVMRRWWHAGSDWETPVAEVELRVGGGFRITMRSPDGDEYTGSGVYRVVDPPRRLEFTWTWAGDGIESLVEVSFEERAGATTVVLTHSGLAGPESVRGHTEGWENVLDNLAAELEA